MALSKSGIMRRCLGITPATHGVPDGHQPVDMADFAIRTDDIKVPSLEAKVHFVVEFVKSTIIGQAEVS